MLASRNCINTNGIFYCLFEEKNLSVWMSFYKIKNSTGIIFFKNLLT